jgi:ABC-type Fe3+ transport system permease subunit
MMVFTLLLFLNLGSYVSYLFWGALSSTTNNLMYIIMLIIIPFVFWIADVKLTFIEGFKEGAKNKNKNKNKESKSSKSKNSKCTKVENYNYIVPLFIVFIIPVVVTLKTFFTLIFRGIYGIPGILLAADSSDIKSRIGKTLGYSVVALIFAYVFIFVAKILEIVNK